MATVTLDLSKLETLTERAAESGLRSALGAGERRLKADLLSRPGTGRQYGKHRASAPGEPPAPDTGALRANTNADTELQREGGDLVGRIVANSAYAEALEKGTERMAPRPYLSTLRDDHADEMREAFVQGAKG